MNKQRAQVDVAPQAGTPEPGLAILSLLERRQAKPGAEFVHRRRTWPARGRELPTVAVSVAVTLCPSPIHLPMAEMGRSETAAAPRRASDRDRPEPPVTSESAMAGLELRADICHNRRLRYEVAYAASANPNGTSRQSSASWRDSFGAIFA
ncbi:hypothetical protein CS8_027270 [Cupriavidus sp. 8B]